MAASPFDREVSITHTLGVIRTGDVMQAVRRVTEALEQMPAGTEVRIRWITRARLHAPYEPDVVRPPEPRARCPRVTPRLRPERVHHQEAPVPS